MNIALTTAARWWRNWKVTRVGLQQLDRCGANEFQRIARDVGVSTTDLRALAGKWPDAAEPLNRRLAALALDPAEIKRSEPQVMPDLQRVCTLCTRGRECEHDLADDPADPVWREYCPNVMTLDALRAERERARNAG
jgi:hypothetical protein